MDERRVQLRTGTWQTCGRGYKSRERTEKEQKKKPKTTDPDETSKAEESRKTEAISRACTCRSKPKR